MHRVRITGLPAWLNWRPLLGEGDFSVSKQPDGRLQALADLPREEASDLAARLRGVRLADKLLTVEVAPPLKRRVVREGRAVEVRRHRCGSTGFTRSGAQLDEEGRLSLTPEALALQLGRRVRAAHVLDACCGGGGNSIGFARAGCSVTAIEQNAERLAMARHNARLYGVSERIEFIEGDARKVVPLTVADLLFIDPPWSAAQDKHGATVHDFPPLEELLLHGQRFAQTWLKLPASFDPARIPNAEPEAFYGVGAGDARRVKFVLIRLSASR